MAKTIKPGPGLLAVLLDRIERAGNRLPHPSILFVLMALGVLVLSLLARLMGVTATHPVSGETIAAVNLLSGEGLRRILTGTVTNFTGFAPVGTVLVAMLGIGIAERAGLIDTMLRRLVLGAPTVLIGFVVALAGVLSSLAADAGYVVLIPLAAMVFQAAGRHPVAGIATAFAAVSAGFSANLMIGPLDAILAGLSTEGVRLVDSDYMVSPAGNWWFIAASTFVIAITVAVVTATITEPRLPAPASSTDKPAVDAENPMPAMPTSAAESRGLRAAAITTLVLILLVIAGLAPAHGVLRDPVNGSILASPFMSGIVVVIALWAALAGVAFGRAAGTFRTGKDIIEGMESTMATMAGYLVLMFFAAQFVAWFSWTNLGLISAIGGSELLRSLNPSPLTLLLLFILVTAGINLFIGSASAKWAIMAPVFVPMLFLLGISPEGAQMAYRIGDSVSNIITPLMPYFALVVAIVGKYDRRAGIGTIIATMLPYSVVLLVVWSLLLSLWFWLNLPLGPGSQFLL
jgi:aminobenzoyl-glutamate transport protein